MTKTNGLGKSEPQGSIHVRSAGRKCHFAFTAAEHAPAQLCGMSFQDDAVEPLAVESAQHFTELLRRAGAREADPHSVELAARERREWPDPRRALPRQLGN